MPNITIEQLRTNQLKKQHLLEKKPLKFFDIAETQLGLHSTDYWTPYISVWARVGDFDAQEIFQAFNQGDRLVRINAFRNTVFVVHVNNLAMILRATGSMFYNYIRKGPGLKNVSDQEIQNKLERLYPALEEKPLRTRDLKKVIPELAPNLRSLVLLAMAQGKIIRASASHAKSTITSYALTSQWVPNLDLNTMSENEALTHLIQRYIQVFGPVAEDDIVWWLRLKKTPVRAMLKDLSDELTTYEIDKVLYYLDRKDYETALSLDPLTEPIITFLPYEDHFPKAFIKRSWFINDEYCSKLFPKNPKSYWPSQPHQVLQPTSKGMIQSGEIRPSIWVNDKIIGRWELEKEKKNFTVVMSLYQDVSPDVLSSIKAKKSELEQFINEQLVPIS